GGGVRGAGLQRVLLSGRAGGDRAVDLVGGHVHEGADAVAQGGVEQDLGGDHVGEDEVGGGEDGAVDVGLGGEVDHGGGLGGQPGHPFGVSEVDPHEVQERVVEFEVVEGAGVGEGVQHGDTRRVGRVGRE